VFDAVTTLGLLLVTLQQASQVSIESCILIEVAKKRPKENQGGVRKGILNVVSTINQRRLRSRSCSRMQSKAKTENRYRSAAYFDLPPLAIATTRSGFPMWFPRSGVPADAIHVGS
jgi:hypothetical protein